MNSKTSFCNGMEAYVLNNLDIEYMWNIINCEQNNEMKAKRLYLYCNLYTILENIKNNNGLSNEDYSKLEKIKEKYYEYDRLGLLPYSYNNYKLSTLEMEKLFLKLNTAYNFILEIKDDKKLAKKLFELFNSASEFKESYMPFLNSIYDKKLEPISYALDNFYMILGTYMRLETTCITKSSDVSKKRPTIEEEKTELNYNDKVYLGKLKKFKELNKELERKEKFAKVREITEYLSKSKEQAINMILEGIDTGFVEEIPFDIYTLAVLLPEKSTNETNLINPLLSLIKSRRSNNDSNKVWFYVINSEVKGEKAIFAFRQENFDKTLGLACEKVDLDKILEIISKNNDIVKKRSR